MAVPQPFSFINLPGEVRNVFYENFFPETQLLIQDGILQVGPASQNPLNNAAILATCRLINQEATFHFRQRIHIVYRGRSGPDRARVANDVRRVVQRITFDAGLPLVTHLGGLTRPVLFTGFNMSTFRPYHSLREVELTFYYFSIISIRAAGESLAELTAVGGPRNAYLVQQLFTKLRTSPTPWRTFHVIRPQSFQTVLRKPFVAGSRSTNERAFRITMHCWIYLYDINAHMFDVILKIDADTRTVTRREVTQLAGATSGAPLNTPVVVIP